MRKEAAPDIGSNSRPRLAGRLPLVSHHPSAGAEVEDDTQPGHSMTQRLCFLSNTPLRSLSNSTTRLRIVASLFFFFPFLRWPLVIRRPPSCLKKLPLISTSSGFLDKTPPITFWHVCVFFSCTVQIDACDRTWSSDWLWLFLENDFRLNLGSWRLREGV